MSLFTAILGTGKGTWAEVHGILALGNFDKVVLFIDEWAAPDYRNEHEATLVTIPTHATTEQLTTLMFDSLKEHSRSELEVAVNIASGTGRQHASLLAALLKTGTGIRLVSFENGEFRMLA